MAEIPTIFLESLKRAPWGWTLTVVVILALIKVWPIIQLQLIEAKAKLRQEGRDDLKDCKQRLDDVNKRLDDVMEQHHRLEMKLLGAISAYRILDNEMETQDPGNTALGQARLVMSAAFTLSPSTEEPKGSTQ